MPVPAISNDRPGLCVTYLSQTDLGNYHRAIEKCPKPIYSAKIMTGLGKGLGRIKTRVRDSLPGKLQVPVKYWYSRFTRTLEPEMALLPLLVARGDHAIDVGGNFGAYAFRLVRLGARVAVFEPNPLCSQALSLWAAAQSGVAVHPVALSSHAGDADLVIPVDAAGVEHDASASIESIRTVRGRHQRVPIRTLDSFGYRRTALIKIDVEGHEASVLDGALGTIAASQPAMIIEIEQRHLSRPIAAVFDQVRALGYRGYFLDAGQLRPIETFRLAVHQAAGAGEAGYRNNFLFLAEDRLRAGDYAAVTSRWIDG